MKNMIKLLALVMAMAMVLCLVACGNPDTPKATEDNGSNETTAPVPTGDPNETTAPVDDGKEDYVITVKDSNGNPVEGVYVNVCKEGASCFAPVKTDANGSAVTRLEPASDYYGSVSSDPETKVYFEDEFQVTIVWDPSAAE